VLILFRENISLFTSTNPYNSMGDRLQQSVDSVTTNYTLDLNTGLTQVLNDGAMLIGTEKGLYQYQPSE
jgi:hypothetical protein